MPSSQRRRPANPIASHAGWFARTRETVAATSAGESIASSRITEPSTGRWTSNVSFAAALALAVPLPAAFAVVSGWVADSI